MAHKYLKDRPVNDWLRAISLLQALLISGMVLYDLCHGLLVDLDIKWEMD